MRPSFATLIAGTVCFAAVACTDNTPNAPDGRTEYVRLTIDPNRAGQLFSWERVPLAS